MTPEASGSLATLEQTRRTRTALRRLDGVATVGDVATETGFSQAESEAALRELLEQYRGHLAVGERGDLVYQFDPAFLDRDHAPAWVRFRETAWDIFKAVYKVSIAVVLVVYFVVFIALAIAALIAMNKDGDGDFDLGGGDRGRGGGLPIGDMLFWYWIWNPNWGWGRPYYGDRYGRRPSRKDRLARAQRPPFYKKVFAYVFGPDRPEDTPERRDRRLLRLARSRGGVLTAADVVQATGAGLDESEEELGRLMAAHDGEAEPTAAGVVYTFPDLMVSADVERSESRPPPAWRRLEPDLPVTGNSIGSNVTVSLINGFNLAAALSAPWLILPALGIDGPLALFGLSIFPAVFSASFFAIPLLRRFSVARENRKRRKRNVRRALLGLLTRASLEGDDAGWVSETEAIEVVREALGPKGKAEKRTRAALDRFVAEFDGEVEVGDDGTMRFRFPGFRRAVEAAGELRRQLRLSRGVGSIVYDSGDDALEESERDLANFDARLARGTPEDDAGESGTRSVGDGNDTTLYLDDPTRFGFRDELELAALEQEMKSGGRRATEEAARGRGGRRW
jgi:hypothetical protein